MGRRQADGDSVMLWVMFCWGTLGPAIHVDAPMSRTTSIIFCQWSSNLFFTNAKAFISSKLCGEWTFCNTCHIHQFSHTHSYADVKGCHATDHQEQFGIQNLTPGYVHMQPGEPGNWTSDLMTRFTFWATVQVQFVYHICIWKTKFASVILLAPSEGSSVYECFQDTSRTFLTATSLLPGCYVLCVMHLFIMIYCYLFNSFHTYSWPPDLSSQFVIALCSYILHCSWSQTCLSLFFMEV